MVEKTKVYKRYWFANFRGEDGYVFPVDIDNGSPFLRCYFGLQGDYMTVPRECLFESREQAILEELCDG